MAGITATQAETQLAAYLDAEQKILRGQRVSMSGKDLTRADLAAVQKGVELWDKRVKSFARSSLPVRQVIPE
jgi:flagella basal body P-ring formation protein FlgA